MCLLMAKERPAFFWITAAFTNATLRLFPCSMDLLHALQRKVPFSDEGEIAMALTQSPFVRFFVVLCFFAAAATLTVLAVRRYQFHKYRSLKAFGIYLLSLGTGICVLILALDQPHNWGEVGEEGRGFPKEQAQDPSPEVPWACLFGSHLEPDEVFVHQGAPTLKE